MGTLQLKLTINIIESNFGFFEERGNWSTRRKPLGAYWRTNKLNPHMTPDLGIEPEPHWWEASALHPNQNVLICKATNKFASFFLDNRCQMAIFTSLSKWIKDPTCFQLKQAKLAAK